MEGKRCFSRVKLLPCPPQALSPPNTGQPALSTHRRKPGSPYVLENYLSQQIHRAGGFRGQIQQSLALTGQLTKPSDGKCSPKGCSTPPKVKVSPVALKQALTQVGATQPPQKPKEVLGALQQPVVILSACTSPCPAGRISGTPATATNQESLPRGPGLHPQGSCKNFSWGH